MVAAASTKRSVPRSYYSMQAGFGVGVGNHGPGASYFVFGDLFPLENLGLGFEAVRAGNTSVRILERNSTATQDAIRGRLTFRWLIGSRGALSASASVGHGSYDNDHAIRCSETNPSEDSCFPDDSYVDRGKNGSGVSFGGQLGVHARHGRVAFGVVLRGDLVQPVPVVHLTLGPTLGFEL